MSRWATTFLVLALMTGLPALMGVAGMATGVAQSLSLIFFTLFLAAMVARTFHDDPPGSGLN